MRWKDALTDFLHYVKLERGLSENSVENYRFDVLKLTRFLTEHNNSVSPIDIKSTTIQPFVYESSKKLKAPSQARMLSGLRIFFDFLILEGLRKDNPLDLIEAPKLGSNLPTTLSVEEVDALIETHNSEKPLELRNMAIIEVLYSCGLRVSELVKLRLSDLFFVLSSESSRFFFFWVAWTILDFGWAWERRVGVSLHSISDLTYLW